MEWLTSIGISAAGLPWWAVLLLLLLVAGSRELIPKLLLWKNANLAERQYDDSQDKEKKDALVTVLEEQVKELKTELAAVRVELREVHAARAKCEVGHAELKGEVAVLRTEIDRLKVHDTANKQQIDVLREDLGKA